MNHYYHNISYISRYALYVVIAAVWICEAWFSEGFHHPDEHFQIIEFAQWKLGLATEHSTPWELRECIRPTLQPVICAGLLKLFRAFGVSSPFTLAFLLRLFAGIVSASAIGCYIKANKKFIGPKYVFGYIAMSYLLWFLPAINVRFSSEVMSGAVLVFLTALLLKDENRRNKIFFYGIGALGALAFELRYQAAFALIGLLAWGIVINKWRRTELLELAAGFAIVCAACSALDIWFYGEVIFAPYNYFKANIIDGVAASFGRSPWYWYLEKILFAPTVVIGVFVIGAIIYALCYLRHHPSVWLLAAFLLFHSFVAHKELRFLFSIINFVPLLLIWGYAALRERKRLAAYAAAIVFAMINTVGLIMMVTKPANYGKARMMRIVAEHYEASNRETAVLTASGANPFRVASLDVSFYKPAGLRIYSYADSVESAILLSKGIDLHDKAVILLQGDKMRRRYIEKHGLRRTGRCMPAWIDRLNKFYNVYDPHWSMAYYEY